MPDHVQKLVLDRLRNASILQCNAIVSKMEHNEAECQKAIREAAEEMFLAVQLLAANIVAKEICNGLGCKE